MCACVCVCVCVVDRHSALCSILCGLLAPPPLPQRSVHLVLLKKRPAVPDWMMTFRLFDLYFSLFPSLFFFFVFWPFLSFKLVSSPQCHYVFSCGLFSFGSPPPPPSLPPSPPSLSVLSFLRCCFGFLCLAEGGCAGLLCFVKLISIPWSPL